MKHEVTIDLRRMLFFFLRWIWIAVICGAMGFVYTYTQMNSRAVDTYTASGTMYVFSGNPNQVNYQYISTADLTTAVQLIDTYNIVMKSDRVMDAVAERLSGTYPGIEPSFISSCVYMEAVGETGVVRVRCVTMNAQMSADICNAVLDVAPAEIVRVVNAGGCEIIDKASVPSSPNSFSPLRRSLLVGLACAAAVLLILLIAFFLNQKVENEGELESRYTPQVLASIRRLPGRGSDAQIYRIGEHSPMEILEGYAKLRTNLQYTMSDKGRQVLSVTSSIANEGKSTIAANLAISYAMSGKRVILIDADLRRPSQQEIFGYDPEHPGLSEILLDRCRWKDALERTRWNTLRILPAGHAAPNPGKLLSSKKFKSLLQTLTECYDLVILDTPPINIVTDSLIITDQTAGALFVTRQGYSDHREIKKALIAAEMAGMEILGIAFYGSKVRTGTFYNRRHYQHYYQQCDPRIRGRGRTGAGRDAQPGEGKA